MSWILLLLSPIRSTLFPPPPPSFSNKVSSRTLRQTKRNLDDRFGGREANDGRVDPLTFEPQVALLAGGRAGTEAHVKSRLTGERTTTVISGPS